MSVCRLCPHNCGVDRSIGRGICGSGENIRISRVSKHMWEEPCISGSMGSGTVFFSGCSLGCVFCQNKPLSCDCIGEDVTAERLGKIFLDVQSSGAHNINLVTPTHFTDKIADALKLVRQRLEIPVVWNSSGYELPGTLSLLQGLVDIYMPDFKYISPELAVEYSSAPDYADYAAMSLKYMYDMLGPAEMSGGLMKRGVLVRHLVLPGCRKDSIAVLEKIAETVPVGDIILGLMAQYTPDFYKGKHANLRRRVTTFEYESVRKRANELGFEGYMQSPMSATTGFTPEFTDKLKIEL